MRQKHLIFNIFRVFSVILISILNLNNSCYAQGPAVEWYNFSWLNKEYVGGGYVDQRHSDYDWWYDHCTAYTNPITKTGHQGYMACGVSFYRSGERSGQSMISYNETSSAYGTYANGCASGTGEVFDLAPPNNKGYDYGNWDNPVTGHLGLDFNSIGRISPSGQTDFLFTSNFGGEYLKVKQLSDGTFITVGSTTATRKRLAAPQNGTPLYYNPTTLNSNDYFINTDIYTNGITAPTNRDHWDVMKFDINGNCLFNNIYGLYDFSGGSATFTDVDGSSKTFTGKQIAYMFSGAANDLVEDVQNNIAVVGSNAVYDETRINPYDVNSKQFIAKPVLIKLDASGKVLGKKILGQGYVGNQKSGTAYAITTANISGVDCYIVLSQISDWGIANFQQTNILIEAFPINNLSAPNVWTKYIAGPAPVYSTANPNGNRNVTCWGITSKNNKLYVPLIADCNYCIYAGANSGNLYMKVYDLSNTNDLTNTVSSVLLSSVNAFDLKSRITELSNGDFAVVSSRKTSDWTTICPGSTPPSYITGPNNNTVAENTAWWNTDTYVARINATGSKIWDKSFDSNSPFTCTDYPTSITSGSGDVKRQECMYGVSEAPDGGIVLSGNVSQNVDDNYMAKLYSDCNILQAYNISSPSTPYNINATVTWNTSMKVMGVIKVNNGGTLNITGAGTIIQFADSKQSGVPTRIEVYPGGKVNINGATLTSMNCPNSMWDGILMIGNGDLAPQISFWQPNVNLTNATISNARTGIANGLNAGTTSAPDYQSGGWIIANNSTFLNNFIDVDFIDYVAPSVAGNEQNNKSYFKNCTFKSDNYLNDPSYIQQIPGTPINSRLINTIHVRLSGVKGIRFISNTFKTDLTNLGGTSFVTNFRSTGIFSNNSIFDVYSTCTLIDGNGNCTGYGPPNIFENLLYGVIAGSSSPLKKFNVTTATFKNCNSSIYQSGINYSKVEKNNFIIDAAIPQFFGKFNCTLHPEACMTHFYYANNSSGFSHQENTYLVASSSPQKVMGTIFNGIGTASNESYNNKYTNCYIGHQSQLTNGSVASVMNGLQIKCNQNTGTKQYDISQTSGILGEQGACTSGDPKSPSNNTFSHFQPSPPSDINAVTTGGFKYNYIGLPPTGPQVPFYTTLNINLSSPCGGAFSQSGSCPSKLTITSTGPCVGCTFITKLQNSATTNLATANQLRTSLINGAAQSLITAIASSFDDGNLKNLLSQYSPYLSDEVLIAYLKKTPSAPSGHIKQIVVSNSPVTTKVMEVLNTMGLPSGILNQINSAQIGTSARTQREKEIAYYNFEKDLNVNEIVRYYLDDTTSADAYANIIKWLEWNNTKPSKVDLVFAKTETRDFTRAQFLIDSLSTDTGSTKYIPYLQANKDMATNGKTWEDLQTNTATKIIIEAIANDSLHPHMGHARAALERAFKTTKQYEFIEGTPNSSASRLSNNSFADAPKNIVDGINLTAYPNPFKDELNINYSILDFEGVAELQLIELASGRIIDNIELTQSFGTKQFNTQNLANGLYVLSLKQNSKPSVNFKVINIK